MSEVKWIKIVTDIFDDQKVRYIETFPNGDEIIVVWFKLLCLAGKSNNHGFVMMTERIAYTDEMLASIFNRNVKSIKMALKTFEELEMIEIIDNRIYISNWEKHQNIDGLEKIKEQNRIRQKRFREKSKSNVTETLQLCDRHSDVTEQNKIENKNKIKNKDLKDICPELQEAPDRQPAISLILNDKSDYPVYQEKIDEWTELFPAVDVIQELRKMKAWLNDNPSRRKTKRGILRFCNNWLSREQDKGGSYRKGGNKVDTGAEASGNEEKPWSEQAREIAEQYTGGFEGF